MKSLRTIAAVLLAPCFILSACGEATEPPEAEPDAAAPPDAAAAPEEPRHPSADAEAADAPAVIRPFNGRDLEGWDFHDIARPNNWRVGAARLHPEDPTRLEVLPDGEELINPEGQTRNPYTGQEFGDVLIELEVMIPEGSNSGIFVMGDYEVQVYDRPTADPDNPHVMDHGAIVREAAPRTYVPPRPGEWQEFRIDFRAPRFDEEGNKTANAVFVEVRIDGRTIHENVELEDTTLGGLTARERPRGPLLLQGNEGPVAFRNIRITLRD